MSEPTEDVIKRHRRQFAERFGEDVSKQTFVAMLNFTHFASEISNEKSQEESDAYLEMVARFVLDIRESHP